MEQSAGSQQFQSSEAEPQLIYRMAPRHLYLMPNHRIRRVDTSKEMERTVDDLVTAGYDIEDQGETSARLQKVEQSVGTHLLLALFFWWLLFIPNLIYWWYQRQNGDYLLVKVDEEPSSAASA